MTSIAAHLNAGVSHSGGDSAATGIYNLPLPPPPYPPPPFFFPSLISLLASVDVKHYIYVTFFPGFFFLLYQMSNVSMLKRVALPRAVVSLLSESALQ